MKKGSKAALPRFVSNNLKTTPPDERGNYFSVESDQLMMIRSISLHLCGENKARHLGTLYIKDRVMRTKRVRSKHLFRMNNSYGFNEHLIRTAILFDHVELHDENGVYLIPRDKIMSDGTYLDYKQIGFERQIFLRLEIIEQFKK